MYYNSALGLIQAISNAGISPSFTVEGDVYHVDCTDDGKHLRYGTVCNVGLLEDGRMEYDPDLTGDENLQALIELATQNVFDNDL